MRNPITGFFGFLGWLFQSGAEKIEDPSYALERAFSQQLKALEEELEAKLAAGASSRPLSPSDQPAPAAVKTLTAKELEVAAAAKAAEAHAYAAKPDDFYPTEKRVKHKDD